MTVRGPDTNTKDQNVSLPPAAHFIANRAASPCAARLGWNPIRERLADRVASGPRTEPT